MKVKEVTFRFKLEAGGHSVTLTDATGDLDMHYIVREGQHIVNYLERSTGERVGVSYPDFDVRRTNTRL